MADLNYKVALNVAAAKMKLDEMATSAAQIMGKKMVGNVFGGPFVEAANLAGVATKEIGSVLFRNILNPLKEAIGMIENRAAAREGTKETLGIGAAFASDATIMAVYNQKKMISDLKTAGGTRVDDLTMTNADNIVSKENMKNNIDALRDITANKLDAIADELKQGNIVAKTSGDYLASLANWIHSKGG